MNQKTKCRMCGREMKDLFMRQIKRYGCFYNVYYCSECSLGYTVPPPSPEYLSELYSSGSYRLAGGKRFNIFVENCISLFISAKRRRIERFKKKGSILDIGCGRGLFLSIMEKHGWRVIGIEFDEDTAVQASSSYGISVRSSVENALYDLPSESFDVITINHVLEHMVNPEESITESKRVLRKGGLLNVSVPDISSAQASAGRERWFHLDVPYHVVHFTEKGLIGLLRKNDFRIERVKRFDLEYNPFGWLQTLLNLTGVRNNLLYDLLKDRDLKRDTVATLRERVVLSVLVPLYSPLSLFLALYESFILRKGGTVEIYAFKE